MSDGKLKNSLKTKLTLIITHHTWYCIRPSIPLVVCRIQEENKKIIQKAPSHRNDSDHRALISLKPQTLILKPLFPRLLHLIYHSIADDMFLPVNFVIVPPNRRQKVPAPNVPDQLKRPDVSVCYVFHETPGKVSNYTQFQYLDTLATPVLSARS